MSQQQKNIMQSFKPHNVQNKNSLFKWLFLVTFFLWFVIYINYVRQNKHFYHFKLNFNETSSLSEKEITAYHEAGHATFCCLFNKFFQFKHVTITKTQKSLGHCTYNVLNSNNNFLEINEAKILTALGGHASQLILYDQGKITSQQANEGIGDDYRKIRRLIRNQNPQINQLQMQQQITSYLEKAKTILQANKNFWQDIQKEVMLKKTLYPTDMQKIKNKNNLN